MMKRTVCILLIAALLSSLLSCAFAETVSADALSAEEQRALDYLGEQLAAPAAALMESGEDVGDIYSALNWTSVADTFPEKFDLRERGTVTSVKSQSPWGTCWSFATMAASEASILNALGMTAEEYLAQNGEEMDLSEKHLAWFTTTALPRAEDYPEGAYPYDLSQAGEGAYPVPGSDVAAYNYGGNYFFAASSLADGIGVVKESLVPYGDSEGLRNSDGDWSLPEEQRYMQSFELKNANVLPAPASIDADGNYVYRPAGTEAIKSELLKGRAVGISFCADLAMPMEPDAVRGRLMSRYGDTDRVSREELSDYVDLRAGILDPAALSDNDLQRYMEIALKVNKVDENPYADADLDREQMIRVLKSRYFGDAYENLVAEEEHDAAHTYLNFSGDKSNIYAQYTFEPVQANHAVTVVGWDDSFPVSAFREGHQPPEPGARPTSEYKRPGAECLRSYYPFLCACLSSRFYACACQAVSMRTPAKPFLCVPVKSDCEFPQLDLGNLQLRQYNPSELLAVGADRHEILYGPQLLRKHLLFLPEQPFANRGHVHLYARAQLPVGLRRRLVRRQIIQVALQRRVRIHFRDQVLPADRFEFVIGVFVFQDLSVCALHAKIYPVQVLHHILEIVACHPISPIALPDRRTAS